MTGKRAGRVAAAAMAGLVIAGSAVAQSQPPAVAPASPGPTREDATNREDFAEYKRRLFELIVQFRRYRTTFPDMERILGQAFDKSDDRYRQSGWIIGVNPTYKSLRMNHRVALYYDPVRGKSTIKKLEFEVEYYVNFAQADPPMAIYRDRAHCLSVAELETVLKAAKIPYKFEPAFDVNHRLITSGSEDLMKPDGRYLLVNVDLTMIPMVGGARSQSELPTACVESVLIS